MQQTMIITGMGAGLSMGVAEYFGSKGFTIGMISRNAEKLEGLKAQLAEKGITAHYTIADAGDTDELLTAIETLKNAMGHVDVLHYNAVDTRMKPILEEDVDDLVNGFRVSVGNALAATKALMPELKKNKGAVLLTGGGSGLNPNPDMATISLGKAGIRNLALQLHHALKPEGIYAGTVTINGWIRHESTTHSPAILATKFWQIYNERSAPELAY